MSSHVARFWFRTPHLVAAGLAGLLTTAFLLLLPASGHLEKRLAHWTGPEVMEVKDQGLALQAEAFHDNDLLPIYGSSELRNGSAYAGGKFFAAYPTGFGLFTVGKAGAKTLIVAERIGALGRAVRGRKVVIILSPTWFLSKQEPQASYRANFSALQAGELVFDSPLSPGLKRDLAREMLKYPKTLQGHDLLRLELRRLAKDTPSLEDRLLLKLGRSEDHFLRLLDRWQTAFALFGDVALHPSVLDDLHPHPRTRPDWNRLVSSADEESRLAARNPVTDAKMIAFKAKLARAAMGKDGGTFMTRLRDSDEWSHLDLLLRTLKELGARPFILNQPINGTAFGRAGVTPAERAYYYARVRNAVRDYGFPFATFERDEDDPLFFSDSLGHPSGKGWMRFNRVIDQFYHDKLPPGLD